jgi:hypothetical protein
MGQVRTCLVSYATERFVPSQKRLEDSALRHGVGELRSWNPGQLQQTDFYATHRQILDRKRGAGYWLWKPFIIESTLNDLHTGDIVIYSDAGIEIVAGLHPLIEVCQLRTEVLLFAGHYDDVGGPGPNTCGKWTRRDCFVGMDCDRPCYHNGQMLDASFLVIRVSPQSMEFVREWLGYCVQPELLIDGPNLCGLPDLPGFIEHRHDQSILSLLAIRREMETFRHPSQFGNHLKEEAFRERGEWTRRPYGSSELYRNSQYGTLLNHHRKRLPAAPDQIG